MIEASTQGDLNGIQKLLKNSTSTAHISAFDEAVKNRHVDIVNYLLQESQHIQSQHKGSALIQAVDISHVKLIKVLLKQAKDISKTDKNQALYNASIEPNIEIMSLLLDSGADFINDALRPFERYPTYISDDSNFTQTVLKLTAQHFSNLANELEDIYSYVLPNQVA